MFDFGISLFMLITNAMYLDFQSCFYVPIVYVNWTVINIISYFDCSHVSIEFQRTHTYMSWMSFCVQDQGSCKDRTTVDGRAENIQDTELCKQANR